MSHQTQKFRLDQILTEMGLVSEEQVKVALDLQKIYGGRFGSLLLHKGFIDEAGLVKALARQLGCNGVVLSKLELQQVVYQMLPRRVALARKAIPFDYDIENNILKVACADPSDKALINELGFFVRGKKVELYVAADIALNAALSKYYLGKSGSMEDSIKLEIPDEFRRNAGQENVEKQTGFEADNDLINEHPTVLLVTDDTQSTPLLKLIFEQDGFQVVVTDSANEAIQMLGGYKFHTVFIKDTVPGDYIDLIERVRKLSPKTVVRYFESTSSLLLNENAIKAEADLLLKNLDLFTSLLSSKSEKDENHSGQVGQYVERLCRELEVPDKDRVLIATAAYIHDIARYYYDTDKYEESHQEIYHTIKLLSSLNYSPVILEMLRMMYVDLKGKYTRRLPVEVLGGNILTIADLFCDSIDQTDRLSMDKFETVKEKMHELVGKLFLPEVVDAFVNMIQNDILDHYGAETGQVLMFSEDRTILQPIELRLKNEGFSIISNDSKDMFMELYNRSQPDMMILAEPGTPDRIIEMINDLSKEGIDFENVPAFLLTEGVCIPRVTSLLERGIEDIIPFSDNYEMLVSKVKKLKIRLDERRKNEAKPDRNQTGALGRLSDMNLIDLIQAMGPSNRTARITVCADDKDSDLVIYLNRGMIWHAAYKAMTGADAVYEGLGWTNGHWSIESINESDLPAANNQLTNESILMEGCRLIDEKKQLNSI